jgi:hypothetical protein
MQRQYKYVRIPASACNTSDAGTEVNTTTDGRYLQHATSYLLFSVCTKKVHVAQGTTWNCLAGLGLQPGVRKHVDAYPKFLTVPSLICLDGLLEDKSYGCIIRIGKQHHSKSSHWNVRSATTVSPILTSLVRPSSFEGCVCMDMRQI